MNELVRTEFKKRVFDECIPRITSCLERLSTEQVWLKPNDNSNSIGNLILHLCGNVRQWICSGIGSYEDIRQRDWEFRNEEKFNQSDLIKRLMDLEDDCLTVLSKLSDDELKNERTIQGYTLSTFSAIIHVIEHFSYHTGQIALLTKIHVNQDLEFYAGRDLSVKNQ